ncbi:MAG: hypothetical protein H7249_18650 [Chitinophagaceae bacterium]|nr:hypothetical protein [Oligoflexus sp.]
MWKLVPLALSACFVSALGLTPIARAADSVACVVHDFTALRSNEAPEVMETNAKPRIGGTNGAKSLPRAVPSAPSGGSGTETTLMLFGDNQVRKVLHDVRYSIQVAQYVGQIQILLIEASSRKNLVMVTTPDKDFTGLNLINTIPNVAVSCVLPSKSPGAPTPGG